MVQDDLGDTAALVDGDHAVDALIRALPAELAARFAAGRSRDFSINGIGPVGPFVILAVY